MPTETQEDDTLYQLITASQTNTALTGGSGGSIGDFLKYVVILPQNRAGANPGAVSLTDGSGSSFFLFKGGSASVSDIYPIQIKIGAKSISGPWKITTGANIKVIAVGKFK